MCCLALFEGGVREPFLVPVPFEEILLAAPALKHLGLGGSNSEGSEEEGTKEDEMVEDVCCNLGALVFLPCSTITLSTIFQSKLKCSFLQYLVDLQA